MNTNILIFLGFVALAIGSEIKGQEKPLEKPLKKALDKPLNKPHSLPKGVEIESIEPLPFVPRNTILPRQIRAADGGSAGVSIDHNDKSGTTGTVSASQNVWNSADGKTSVDVGGSVSKNVDHGNTDAKVGVNVNWG